jgi:hypothetical protein
MTISIQRGGISDISDGRIIAAKDIRDGIAGLTAEGRLNFLQLPRVLRYPIPSGMLMRFPTAAATYSPTTASEINTAFSSATAGQIIDLPDGTYSVNDITPAAGVIIRGPGKSLCTLNARLMWNVNGSALVNWMSGFTLNMAGKADYIYGPCEFVAGKFRLWDMRITQADTGKVLCVSSKTAKPYNFLSVGCEFDHSATDDVVATKPYEEATADARCIITNFWIHHCGDSGSDQLVSAHGIGTGTPQNQRIELYNGLLTNPGATERNAVMDDAVCGSWVIGCVVDGMVFGNRIEDCIINALGANYGAVPRQANATILRNYIYGAVLGQVACDNITIADIDALVEGNILDNPFGVASTYGIRVGGSAIETNFLIQNNTILGSYRGVDGRTKTGRTVVCINNAIEASSTSILGDGDARIDGDFNTVNKSVSGYTLGTNDIVDTGGVDLNPIRLPILGGNCHANGQPIDFQTPHDLNGVTRPTRVAPCRGALEATEPILPQSNLIEELFDHGAVVDGGGAVGTFTLATQIPAGHMVTMVQLTTEEQCAGSSVVTLILEIGDGSDADRFASAATVDIHAVDIDSAWTEAKFQGDGYCAVDTSVVLQITEDNDITHWRSGPAAAGKIRIRLYHEAVNGS